MTVVLVVIAIVLVLVLIFFSSLKVRLQVALRGEDQGIILTFAWLKFIRHTWDFSFVDMIDQMDRPGSWVRTNFALSYLTRRIRINRFRWHSEIGIGEAHYTGLAAGILWTLKSTLVTGLFAYTTPSQNADLAVFPNYNQHRLQTALDFKFEIRIGHLLLAGLKSVRRPG